MKHELAPLFSLDPCMKLVFLMLLFGMLTGCGKGHGGGQVAGDMKTTLRSLQHCPSKPRNQPPRVITLAGREMTCSQGYHLDGVGGIEPFNGGTNTKVTCRPNPE